MLPLNYRQRRYPKQRFKRSKKNGTPSRRGRRGRNLKRRRRMAARIKTQKTRTGRRWIKIPRNQHLPFHPPSLLRSRHSHLIPASRSIGKYSLCASQNTRSVDKRKSRRPWLLGYLVFHWPRLRGISRLPLLYHDQLLHTSIFLEHLVEF